MAVKQYSIIILCCILALAACQGATAQPVESGQERSAVGVAASGDEMTAGENVGSGVDGATGGNSGKNSDDGIGGDNAGEDNSDSVRETIIDDTDDTTRGPDITATFTDPHFLDTIRSHLKKEVGEPIYADEAAALDSLTLRYKSVTHESNLDGIEYFKNLTYLDCSDFNLRELDLSANIELRRVFCAKNRLESLRLPASGKLVVLDCPGNRLTSLDVSSMAELARLNCSANQLVGLDLTSNEKLTDLDCSDNRLRELDLVSNGKLTSLDCSDNQLESLDVSACAKLEFLSCERNALLSEQAVIGLDKSTLWGYSFRPQNAGTPQGPIDPATLTAAAAAPSIAQGKYYYSFAGIDPALGPGPFSVNELSEIYGPPEALAAKRVSVSSGSFAITAYFADVGFELVAGIGDLSFATEENMGDAPPDFEITAEDLALKIMSFTRLCTINQSRSWFLVGAPACA
jgi:hypothetical protein